MPHQTLTDSEVAVTRNSLADERDKIRGMGIETPNIDSAIEKMDKLITPHTYGMALFAGQTTAFVVARGFAYEGIQIVEPEIYLNEEDADARKAQLDMHEENDREASPHWGLVCPIQLVV